MASLTPTLIPSEQLEIQVTDCLSCTHPEDHHAPVGCHTAPDGARAEELTGQTCHCGGYRPPGNPQTGGTW